MFAAVCAAVSPSALSKIIADSLPGVASVSPEISTCTFTSATNAKLRLVVSIRHIPNSQLEAAKQGLRDNASEDISIGDISRYSKAFDGDLVSVIKGNSQLLVFWHGGTLTRDVIIEIAKVVLSQM